MLAEINVFVKKQDKLKTVELKIQLLQKMNPCGRLLETNVSLHSSQTIHPLLDAEQVVASSSRGLDSLLVMQAILLAEFDFSYMYFLNCFHLNDKQADAC